MVPGKKYKPEDFLQIAWRCRWWIITPFVVATIAALGYARTLPDRYRTSTLILVVPQQVPVDYVRPAVTTLIADRLQMISQEILSRTQLERIISEFNLYPEERKKLIMEDVIERMRNDIDINIVPARRRRADTNQFSVGFEADDPRTALKVTERLASLFIRENIEDRTVLADSTSEFLQAQLDEARRRLVDHEKKLEEYRLRNAGSLPTQVQGNLQSIQNTQFQLQSLREAASRDRDRRVMLERQLADAIAQRSQPRPVQSDSQSAPAPATAVDRLAAAQAALRNLETRLRPEHPDVQRAKRIIRELEKAADIEVAEQAVAAKSTPAPVRALTAEDRLREGRIGDMQVEIENIDRRMTGQQEEERRLLSALSTYQARVEAAPARESELIELMRDYDTLKTSYSELLKKTESSKLAASLEQRQIGEQFKIVDAARLPEKPLSTERTKIVGLGAAGGLGFGLAIVALLAYRDTSLRTDEDVLTALSLPVVALIPAMTTRSELRARLRRRWLMAGTSAAIALAAAALVIAWKTSLLTAWVH